MIITTKIRVVNITNQSAKISGNNHEVFHRATSSKNILQAKLQGANHAKNAIVRVGFLHCSFSFLNALWIKYKLKKNKIIQLTSCT